MAVSLQGIGVVNFEVYYAGTERLLGISSIELTTNGKETTEMKGNGIMGTISMPVRGNLESVELKFTWRATNDGTAEIYEHKRQDLSLYANVEHHDGGTGEFKAVQYRFELGCIPKSWNLGKWEPSSTMDSEQTFEVLTYAFFIDGVEQEAWDKLNYVWRVHGEEMMADHRKAVGMI